METVIELLSLSFTYLANKTLKFQLANMIGLLNKTL